MSSVRECQRFYTSSTWRNHLRPAMLMRDGHRCTRCGSDRNLSGHHLVPLVEGGDPFDLANVTTLCASCHTEQEGSERNARAGAPVVLHPRLLEWIRHWDSVHDGWARMRADRERRRTARADEVLQRARRAAELREDGVGWAEIASRVGYASAGAAYNAAARARTA